MLSDFKRDGLLTVGRKQTLKGLSEGKLTMLYIAQDADPYVTKNIEEMAINNKIKIIYVTTMKELGKSCGIAVGAAVAGVLSGK